MGAVLQGFELDCSSIKGWEPAKKTSDMAQTKQYLEWKKAPKPEYYRGT
jgi:hypothetical protein